MMNSTRARSPRRRRERAETPGMDNGALDEGPYLTHVQYHLGRLTLVPPENLGRIRKPRSKSRTRIPSPTENIGIAGPSNLSAASPNSRMRKHRSKPPCTPPDQRQGHRAERQSLRVPDSPPPSFEEAISPELVERNDTLTSRNDAISRTDTRSPSIMSLPSDDGGSSIDIDIVAPEKVTTTPSEWELDLRAGFSLEERVKREWERRHAELIPNPILAPYPPPKPSKLNTSKPSDSPSVLEAEPSQSPASPASSAKALRLTEESDWEIIDGDTTLHPSSSSRPPDHLETQRTSTNISVKDRIKDIEALQTPQSSSAPSLSHPRRSPPPLPPKDRTASTSLTKTDHLHNQIPKPFTSTSILRTFDPLYASSSEDSCSSLSIRDQLMGSRKRPLPPTPASGTTPSIITAYDAFRLSRQSSETKILIPETDFGQLSDLDPPPDSSNTPLHEPHPEDIHSDLPDVAPGHTTTHNPTVTRPLDIDYTDFTELDVLVSRLEDEGTSQGAHYNELLLVEEILGDVPKLSTLTQEGVEPLDGVPVGRVEVQRRRVTKAGRVKLKLSLLGIAVDRCGICLSQFKADNLAALLPRCRHCYHEKCLRSWLRRSCTCPTCRLTIAPA